MLAPALLLSLLATFDFGTGMSQRMALDHVLRAGAQSAMIDLGTGAVEAAMSSAAKLTFSDGLPTMSVEKFCACPEALEAAVACTTVCTESQPTFTYYRMIAELSYAGVIVPPMDFQRSLRVQVR